MSQQHKALLIHKKGARLELGTRATPAPAAGQMLVRNRAVAVNPADAMIQKLGIFLRDEQLPAVIGFDAAGEVHDVGPNVTGWKKGDRVLYEAHTENDQAAFQEYTLVDATLAAKIPSNVTFEQAASIPLGLATATIGIYQAKRDALRPDTLDSGGAGITPPWVEGGRGKYAGQAAVVIGGASSVGQYATQFLKLSGFSPLIATASKHNEAYCKAAGAAHVVDYNDVPYPELPAKVREIVGEQPVTLVFDAACKGGSQTAGFTLLASGGSLVAVKKAEVGERGKDDAEGRRVVWPYGNVNEEDHKAFGADLFAHISDMLEKGELKPNNVRVLDGGLAAIPAGCDELLRGVSGVKLVARID